MLCFDVFDQISIVMAAAKWLDMGDAEALKAMRTLRALRPLRAVSRWEGMRVIYNIDQLQCRYMVDL